MRRLLQLRRGGQRAWPQPCPLPLLRLPARAAPGHLSHSVSALSQRICLRKPPAIGMYAEQILRNLGYFFDHWPSEPLGQLERLLAVIVNGVSQLLFIF